MSGYSAVYQQTYEMQQSFVTPSIIPELEGATTDELKEFLENDDLLTDLVLKLPVAQKLQKDLENMSNVNEVLANGVLAMEDDLSSRRLQVAQRRSQFSLLGARWLELQSAHQALSEKLIPHSIKGQLHEEAVAAEEESEGVAEFFLNKEINVDAFLTEYLEKRKLSHGRKAKEEGLSKQLQELERHRY